MPVGTLEKEADAPGSLSNALTEDRGAALRLNEFIDSADEGFIRRAVL